MSVLLLIGGAVGLHYINRTNKIVNNIFDEESNKYETFSGVFVCYDKYNNIHSVSELNGKRVGLLLETSNGISYLAKEVLDEAKIDYALVDYKTNTELMTALIDGKVDAIAITSAYRSIYGARDEEGEVQEIGEEVEEEEDIQSSEETGEEEHDGNLDQGDVSPFAIYMNNLIDFNPFERELEIDKQKATKDIANEPFNVLLIGYSRTDIGSPIGLADSIIVTTINPQTYTVSMTSIARDSFVPISCYSGEYDKINSGRSTSRACFIETVEDFIGMDIDHYMELDYLGLVQIVNAIGGITISNPVEFTLDGIYVPAGDSVFADGQMALQFCRERHHMPGGDFDRQQHQKEVIMAIAKKLVESGDLTLALNAMDQASEWMSTDFTLSELTSVFNLLLNTKNFTGLDTFDLVDFQNTRMTGYGGIMYYSYDMRLPLWVYLVYQGSYDESMQHINNVMGNWESTNQDKNLSFSLNNKYVKEELISTDYEDKYMFTPDPMPPFWATLVGNSEAAARAWARANGVNLVVKYIYRGDDNYNASYADMVVDQSVRYGSLVSEYPSGTITVMGPDEIDESKMVPDFREHSYRKAVAWGELYGIRVSIEWDPYAAGDEGDVVSQSPKPYTLIEEVDRLRIVVKGEEPVTTFKVKFNKNGYGYDEDVPKSVEIDLEADYYPSLKSMPDTDGYEFKGWYTTPDYTQGERITSFSQLDRDTVLYARWSKKSEEHKHKWELIKTKEATCEKDGYERYECSCGETKDEPIPALGHKWKVTTKPTCDSNGEEKCTREGCGKTRSIDKLSGDECQVVPEPEPEPEPEPDPDNPDDNG